jgi:Spy/CpxP family protein refolding chaperone
MLSLISAQRGTRSHRDQNNRGPLRCARRLMRNRFAAWTAVAALGAASLFAAETAPAGAHRHGRMGAFLSSYLNLTPAQQAQQKSIFESARQSAQPVRQQLRQTRQGLRAAVQANNAAQIQQLASTEGSEVGQLAAIRGTAMAKAYQVLTPNQQQQLAKLEQAHAAARHAHAAGAQTPSAGAEN